MNGVSMITTHLGGPFYDWYKSIFGKAPPATVASNNPIYVAWTQGVKKATVKSNHPSGIAAAGAAILAPGAQSTLTR